MKKLITSSLLISVLLISTPAFAHVDASVNQSSSIMTHLRAFASKIYLTLSGKKMGPSSQVTDEPVTVAITGTKPVSGLAALVFWGSKEVKWETSGYPKGVGVNINLIKKVSSDPDEYVLVRKIAEDTSNDGKYRWFPSKDETGDDYFIEVTCIESHQFNGGCQITSIPAKS